MYLKFTMINDIKYCSLELYTYYIFLNYSLQLLHFPPSKCPYYDEVIMPEIYDTDVHKDFVEKNQVCFVLYFF